MSVDLNDLQNIAPEALDNALKNLSDEPTKFLGHAGKSILSICFGGIDYYAERLDYKRQIKLENWKQSTFDKLGEIPQERRIDPPLYIAGPIVEASKFYFEDDYLSKLFSKLLVAACDEQNFANVHPSFVEMLKQMSPLDAKIMNLAKTENTMAVATYRLENDNGEGVDIYKNVFYQQGDSYTIETLQNNSSSITNLIRLKLLDCEPGKYLVKDEYYNVFYDDPIYKNMHDTSFQKNALTKGYVFVTPLGNKFIKACITD